MSDSSDIPKLLASSWRIAAPKTIESLAGAGGFSGARFWRIDTHERDLCLRRWPAEHPSRPRLAWIHRILRHAQRAGIAFVPAPLRAAENRTFAEHQGFLWELTPWLPGAADYRDRPSEARLRAALTALAQFHLAIENAAPDCPRVDVPPAIVARCERLDELLAGGLRSIQQQTRTGDWPELAPRAAEIVGRAGAMAGPLRQQLEPLRKRPLPIQPAIRDIWHDHVLFSDDRVTGLVDFGAMRFDTVATDVARLVGSLVGDNSESIHIAISAYETIRPLSTDEASLIALLDRSGIVIGALNWLDWIYCQGRQFDDRTTVVARLDAMLARMEAW